MIIPTIIFLVSLQISPPPPNPCVAGDINNDGRVDGADVAFVLAFWGTNFQRTDLNDDGIVDGGDLGLALLYWHDCLRKNT